MAIYQTATYRVRPEGIERVKATIVEFVAYVRANEPGTRLDQAWQQQDDPIFTDFDLVAANGPA